MALRDWLGDYNGVATATVATTATVDLQIKGSVAKVATVSVAPPPKSANPLLDLNRKPGMNYLDRLKVKISEDACHSGATKVTKAPSVPFVAPYVAPPRQISTSRRVIFCRDCAHYLPSPPIHRPHGVPREAPGGCRQDRTRPDSWPPIFPFTGWLCDGWAATEAYKP